MLCFQPISYAVLCNQKNSETLGAEPILIRDEESHPASMNRDGLRDKFMYERERQFDFDEVILSIWMLSAEKWTEHTCLSEVLPLFTANESNKQAFELALFIFRHAQIRFQKRGIHNS